MTQEEESRYEDTDALRKALAGLKGRKFRLDCGHHVTVGHNLGNDITVYNGREIVIICSQCGY